MAWQRPSPSQPIGPVLFNQVSLKAVEVKPATGGNRDLNWKPRSKVDEASLLTPFGGSLK